MQCASMRNPYCRLLADHGPCLNSQVWTEQPTWGTSSRSFQKDAKIALPVKDKSHKTPESAPAAGDLKPTCDGLAFSRFSKSKSRGQRQHASVKHGGREGSHCEPVYHLCPRSFPGGREGVCQRVPFSHPRLASSTGAARAPAERPFNARGFFHGGREGGCQRAPFCPPRLASSTGAAMAPEECRFATRVWLLPRGQGGHPPNSAFLPPVSGLFHGGREGTRVSPLMVVFII